MDVAPAKKNISCLCCAGTCGWYRPELGPTSSESSFIISRDPGGCIVFQIMEVATGVGFGPSGQVTLPQNAYKNDHLIQTQTHQDLPLDKLSKTKERLEFQL